MTENKKLTSAVKNGGSKLRNDIILIITIFAVLAAVFLILQVFAKGGSSVKVTIDGDFFGEYSLSEDISVDIVTGEDADGLNRLVIKDGKAFVESANCPDGICAAHKPISLSGESIVCLPHRVVISINADGENDPDVVV